MEVEKKTNKKKWILALFIAITVGVLLGAMAYIMLQVKAFDQVFTANVYVEEIHLGGMTYEEAEKKLEKYTQEILDEYHVILSHKDMKQTIYYKEIPMTYEIKQVLDEAFEIGHTEGFWSRFEYATNRKSIKPAYLEIDLTYTEEALRKTLIEHAVSFKIEPTDATIKRENRQFIITKEKLGEEVDLDQTLESLNKALTSREKSTYLEVTMKPIMPIHTAESLKQIQTPVASFQTYYNDADPLRNENLRVAAAKINKVLAPGEIFSLAEQLEPITAEAGYKPSKVIVNGKLEDGIGGGVCQIASTLYNAVLLTDLDITMRQNHSLPVAYVPLGRDATYATGYIDFKFQNNTKYPVFIESYCENNEVYVNIFSQADLKHDYDEIKFYSETVKVIPAPETIYEEDPTLPKGEEKEKIRALDGKVVKLYRMCYKNGKLVHKELINQSNYRARPATILRGTKAVDASNQVAPVMEDENIWPPALNLDDFYDRSIEDEKFGKTP